MSGIEGEEEDNTHARGGENTTVDGGRDGGCGGCRTMTEARRSSPSWCRGSDLAKRIRNAVHDLQAWYMNYQKHPEMHIFWTHKTKPCFNNREGEGERVSRPRAVMVAVGAAWWRWERKQRPGLLLMECCRLG